MNNHEESGALIKSNSDSRKESGEKEPKNDSSKDNAERKPSRFEQMHPNLKVVIPMPSDQTANAWPTELITSTKCEGNISNEGFHQQRPQYSYQQSQHDYASGAPVTHPCFSTVYDQMTPDRSKAPPPYAPQALGVVPYVPRSATTGPSPMTPNAPPFEMIVRVEQERRLMSAESIDKIDYFKQATRCKAVVAVAAFAVAIVLFAIFIVLLRSSRAMPTFGFDPVGAGRMPLLRDQWMAESGLAYGRRYSDKRQPRRFDGRHISRGSGKDGKFSKQDEPGGTTTSNTSELVHKGTEVENNHGESKSLNNTHIKEATRGFTEMRDDVKDVNVDLNNNNDSNGQEIHFHTNPIAHDGFGPPPPYFTSDCMAEGAPPMAATTRNGGEHDDFLDHFGKISGCKSTTNIIALLVAVILFAIFVVVLVVLS